MLQIKYFCFQSLCFCAQCTHHSCLPQCHNCCGVSDTTSAPQQQPHSSLGKPNDRKIPRRFCTPIGEEVAQHQQRDIDTSAVLCFNQCRGSSIRATQIRYHGKFVLQSAQRWLNALLWVNMTVWRHFHLYIITDQVPKAHWFNR